MAFYHASLSKDVKCRVLRGVDYGNEEREDILSKFVERIAKVTSEDHEEFKKAYVTLQKQSEKKKAKVNVGIGSKKLTFKKKRELGLYTLAKKGLKYNDLLPLHELWKDYMVKYMKLDELKVQGWKNHPEDSNFEMVSQKLYRADYHGSEMTVTRSKCYSLVGTSGIMAMETKNCFKLLGKDNIVRTIPKSTCAFSFQIDEFKFSFFGKNLRVRPAERSAKKIKTVYPNDLE